MILTCTAAVRRGPRFTSKGRPRTSRTSAVFRILALALVPALTGCESGGPTGPTEQPDDRPAGLLRGVALSPAGFPTDYSQITAFFDEVAGFGRAAVMWNGAWRDDAVNGTDAGEVPVAATAINDASNDRERFTPIAVFGWRSGSTLFLKVPEDPTNDWSNAAARTAFAEMVRAYASAHRPAFVFLGNESDFYFEQDPVDYARWVQAYNDAYDAIKSVSPETRVGPVFNVEHMMGWGTFSGWTVPHTGAFTLHDRSRIDVVGLTVYPYLGIPTPEAVPASYLAPVFSLIGDLPIAITETGWPASSGGQQVAWQPGETQQVAYLARLAEMLEDRSVQLVNWLFLHPMAAGSPDALATFGSVSLRGPTVAKRPVYDAFVAFGEAE